MSYEPLIETPKRPCISFEEIQEGVKAKQIERDEHIVSKWLDILTLEYVKEKISEAMLDGKVSVVLIHEDIGPKEKGIDYRHLVNTNIGKHTESIRETVLYYVVNDEKYRFYYDQKEDNKSFEFGITWSNLDDIWAAFLANACCCLLCCCGCCMICAK